MWYEITKPVKRYSGTTSGTVTVPRGASIIHLQFTGGTCSGFPDGQGGTITLTAAAGSGTQFVPNYIYPEPNGATLTFSSTTTWWVDIMSPEGF